MPRVWQVLGKDHGLEEGATLSRTCDMQQNLILVIIEKQDGTVYPGLGISGSLARF